MSTTQKFCPHCGSPVLEGARFCASCGANVAPVPVETPAPPPRATAVPPPQTFTPPTAPHQTAPKSDRSGLVLVVIGIALLLAVLAFFFFRPRNGSSYEARNEAEQAYPQPTDRTGRPKPPEPIIEVPPSQPVDRIEILEEQPTATDLTTTSISPSPVPITPPPDSHAGEISEGDAINRVANYVRSNDYYDIPSSCFRVRSVGYENVGYNIEVIGTCSDIGNDGKILGRWRVDAKDADVFVQRSDGRYLRPN